MIEILLPGVLQLLHQILTLRFGYGHVENSLGLIDSFLVIREDLHSAGLRVEDEQSPEQIWLAGDDCSWK